MCFEWIIKVVEFPVLALHWKHKGGEAIGSDTGFLVNSGSNSGDLAIFTIISELDTGDVTNTVGSGDAFFYVTDDGSDSRVFYYTDSNNNAGVDTGEVTVVTTLQNVEDATQLSVDVIAGFA